MATPKRRALKQRRQRIDLQLVFDVVERRGYTRAPGVESLHTVLIKKLGLSRARRSRKTR